MKSVQRVLLEMTYGASENPNLIDNTAPLDDRRISLAVKTT